MIPIINYRKLAVWVAATGAAAIAAIIPLHTPARDRMVDLRVYRGAGAVLLHGGRLYDYVAPNGDRFTYPPFAAFLAAPLSLLPALVVQILWALSVVGLLVLLVAMTTGPLQGSLMRRFPAWLGPQEALLVLVALGVWSGPVRSTLHFGQVGPLLAALVVADCTVERPRWPRGMLVGLAAAIKLVPGIFAPYLWLSGRRRAGVVATLTFGLTTGLSAFILPTDSATFWFHALRDPNRVGPPDLPGNQSLRGMLLRAHLPGATRGTILFVTAGTLIVVGLRRAARCSSPGGHETAALAIVGCVSIAVSPVSWTHHLVWLAIAAAVAAEDPRRRSQTVAAAALILVVWVAMPYVFTTLLAHRVPGRPLWELLVDLPGLAAIAVVLALPGRRHADDATPATVRAETPDSLTIAGERLEGR